jgi:hypothetical protein
MPLNEVVALTEVHVGSELVVRETVRLEIDPAVGLVDVDPHASAREPELVEIANSGCSELLWVGLGRLLTASDRFRSSVLVGSIEIPLLVSRTGSHRPALLTGVTAVRLTLSLRGLTVALSCRSLTLAVDPRLLARAVLTDRGLYLVESVGQVLDGLPQTVESIGQVVESVVVLTVGHGVESPALLELKQR